jgi:RASD family protein 2
MADQDTRYRLVVLGASRTGKSSIIHMFLNGKFLDTYKETVEDLHYREFTVDDKTIKVDILDTAGKIIKTSFLSCSHIHLGNMEFPAMRRLSIATAHAFILVYCKSFKKKIFVEIDFILKS